MREEAGIYSGCEAREWEWVGRWQGEIRKRFLYAECGPGSLAGMGQRICSPR